MQFNREDDASLRPLPAKHIDTGMGFERLVSILQDKPSNYDTDVFTPIFNKIQELTGARAYTGLLGAEDKDGIDTAYRVVADHVRTLTFAISDGGVPDRDGRGYVLRRILRRGTRYVRKYFQVPIGSFFSQLVPTLVDQMGHFFPEITKKVEDVKAILDEEEASFARTLDRGEKLFEEYAAKAKAMARRSLAETTFGSSTILSDSQWILPSSWLRSRVLVSTRRSSRLPRPSPRRFPRLVERRASLRLSSLMFTTLVTSKRTRQSQDAG